MPTAHCKIAPCQWSQWRETMDEAVRLRAHHEALRHPDVYGAATNQPPSGEVVQLADWWSRAIEAVAAMPEGVTFTLYEACKHLPEPPNPRAQWGRLAQDAHHMGLIEPAGFCESSRPGSASSAVKRWRRTGTAAKTGRRTA